ncbi:MAG: glycoside hydrolase family protein [Candidatus Kapaibacteriota bacterium]
MNRENAIRIAKEHLKKYEGFSSKSPDKNIPYSTLLPLSDDTLVYAYPDGKGYSIGWGTYDKLSDGTKVTKGFSIKKKRADYELDLMLTKIDKEIFPKIKRELTDTQYAALLDTSYNAGSGALKYKGLLDAVNMGKDTTNIFPTVAITNSKDGKVMPILVKRRQDAAKLYNGFYDQYYKFKKVVIENKGKIGIGVGLILIGISVYLYKKK